jgi:PhnB protein
MPAVYAYLSFSDKCEEAFEFYRSVFGGEFASFSRMGDSDFGMDMISEDEKSKVMHVSLPIGNTILMGSDTPGAMGEVTGGNNMSLAITPDSEDDARRIYDGLSAGGNASMPLGNAPWGALFGMLTDKYGFTWMINYDQSRAQE